MKRMQRAMDGVILAIIVRLMGSLRRAALERARETASERAQAVLPAALLRRPPLVALGMPLVALEASPARNRAFRRWILVGILVAAMTSLGAFAIMAIVRRRRSSRGAVTAAQAASTASSVSAAPEKEPFVIPIEVPAAADRGGPPRDEARTPEEVTAAAEAEAVGTDEAARKTSPAEA